MSTVQITTIKNEIDRQTAILKGADTRLHRSAEMELERLRKQLGHAEADAARYAAATAQREADRASREQAEREQLEARLMTEYRAASPATTEQEARAALPDLLHRHRMGQIAEQDAVVQRAKQRIGRML